MNIELDCKSDHVRGDVRYLPSLRYSFHYGDFFPFRVDDLCNAWNLKVILAFCLVTVGAALFSLCEQRYRVFVCTIPTKFNHSERLMPGNF